MKAHKKLAIFLFESWLEIVPSIPLFPISPRIHSVPDKLAPWRNTVSLQPVDDETHKKFAQALEQFRDVPTVNNLEALERILRSRHPNPFLIQTGRLFITKK